MKIKHSFIKGLNRDISKDKFPNDAYYYLLNGRILTDDNATMSDIINLKGNSTANINDNSLVRTNYSIIGYCTIKNDIILFYAENTSITNDDYTTTAIIDRLTYTTNDIYNRSEIWNGTGLNFRVDKKIRALGRVEDFDITKIYWVDNNEPVKSMHLEITDNSTNSKSFDIIGHSNNINPIEFNDYTSGSLKPGMIYYSYRLIKRNGSKTKFLTLSKPIPTGRHLNKYDLNDVKGDVIYDENTSYNTGQGINSILTISDNYSLNFYDTIEIVSIWQSSLTSVPDVTIISKLDINTSKDTYYITDEGTSNYGSIEYSEFLNQMFDFSAKDIVSKDNRLFVGNINEKYFNLDVEASWTGKSTGDEWDSRAYRFQPIAEGNRATFFAADLVTTGYVTPGNYSGISYDGDCINKWKNNIGLDGDVVSNPAYNYAFKADGITLGGEGEHIAYNFNIASQSLIDLNQFSPKLTKVNTKDHLGFQRGFQRDEIYRFGIVFFDTKGRSSFVKWIGDIRMPKINDSDAGFNSSPVTTFTTNSGEILSRNLLIDFNISNIPTINGTSLNYQIVYVKRENKDKSVVYAGLASSTLTGTIHSVLKTVGYRQPADINFYDIGFVPDGASLTANKQIFNISSPEIVFNKTDYLPVEYLECEGILTGTWSVETQSTTFVWGDIVPDYSFNTLLTDQDYLSVRKFPTLESTGGLASGRLNVTDQAKVGTPLSSSVVVDIGTPYTNWGAGGTTGVTEYQNGPKGTNMVLITDNTFTTASGATVENKYFYVYGRANVFESQYGGLSYENRTSNNYIAATPISNSSSVTTEFGDTFISLFEYQNIIRQHSVDYAMMDTNYIVCETQINCLLRSDHPFSKGGSYEVSYVNEEGYIDVNYGITYPALYGYNSAYSRTVDIVNFFPKPSNFKDYTSNETMVRYSEYKLDKEDSDSWLNFKTNNFHYADAFYGSINRLVEFNNNILSFQDNAVSLLPINSKVTTQSNDGVSITLGTGAVIDDFRYLTTDIGCQDNSDVIKSFSSLYWLDKNKKKIYTFNNQIQSISDLKGIHSYLKNNITEESNLIGTYDIKNSEVILTVFDEIGPNNIFIASDLGGGTWNLLGNTVSLDYNFIISDVYKFNNGWFRLVAITDTYLRIEFSHGTTLIDAEELDLHTFMTERDNFTIAYNEKLQSFTSFYSFVPDLYISHNKDFFTSINTRDLWQHNISSNYNQFYDIAYPLQLKLISTISSELQTEFTNFEYFMTVKDIDNEYKRNETITNIHCKNEYQDTEDILLYPLHLPNDSDRTKYVLDTSSTKIGIDWYNGYSVSPEGLIIHNNELYRNISGGYSNNAPPHADYVIAELANIRKTVEHWHGQIPRYNNRNGVYDATYLTSDRLRSNWIETTFEFRSVLDSINIEERNIKLSDIILSGTPLQF